MSAPKGLGLWVAFESEIDDGPKAADLAKALRVCELTGARWVALRCGAGGQPDHDLTEASILAFKEAGLDVYLWPFVYSYAAIGELGILHRWRSLCLPGGRAAVDGVILNAEFEYMAHGTPAEARKLVSDMRALGYDFVAHAPPDYAGGRGEGPLATLDEVCDAIMPQVYGYEHDDRGHVLHLHAVMALYEKRGLHGDKVWPILCTYRPKTRGYTKDESKTPIPTPPLLNEAEVVAHDVASGLAYCDELRCPTPSLYTIDALHFASRPGVGDAVLAALTARHASEPIPPTDRMGEPVHEMGLELGDGGPAHPLGVADRAELGFREHDFADSGVPTRPGSSQSSQRLAAVNATTGTKGSPT